MDAKKVSLDEWCRYWGAWADKQNNLTPLPCGCNGKCQKVRNNLSYGYFCQSEADEDDYRRDPINQPENIR